MMTGMIEFYNLEKTPSCARDKTHYYCDYVELLALISGVDGISSSDVYDRFLEDERLSDIGSSKGAEQSESWMSEIDSWFGEVASRSIAYGESYPFLLRDRRLTRKPKTSDKQKIYIGLLLCSSLRHISENKILSSAFEYASFCAMRNYLPTLSEVHIFGVSSGFNSRYSGSLESKRSATFRRRSGTPARRPRRRMGAGPSTPSSRIVFWRRSRPRAPSRRRRAGPRGTWWRGRAAR